MVPDSTWPTRARPLIGAVLKNKWRIEALLGTGGMASVFRATHRNGHRVALKVLHMEFSCDLEIRRRFLLEGYAANAIEHPGVVRVLDDDVTEDGAAFLVMELLEGETLCDRCERLEHRAAASEVVAVSAEVLDLLAAAHAQGIVHRDIKPDNVFVTTEGAVKVLDFGIAQIRRASPGSFATLAGATFGTPSFMSPEQALGRSHEVDGRSDVWSTGATIFWALSGRFVHDGATINETLVCAATRAAPPLASVVPDVPPELAAVVDRALAMERDARWQDAGAMRDALRRARLDRPYAQSLVEAPGAARAGSAKRRRLMAAAVAAVGASSLFALGVVGLHAAASSAAAARPNAAAPPVAAPPFAPWPAALPAPVVTSAPSLPSVVPSPPDEAQKRAVPLAVSTSSSVPSSELLPSNLARSAKAAPAPRTSVRAPASPATPGASSWLDQR